MTSTHLSEEALQACAMQAAGSGEAASAHIAFCEECRAAVAVYRQLFAAVKEQPAAAFDFDLAALVLQQLPEPKKIYSPIMVLSCFFSAALVIVPAWVFRKYLLAMVSGMIPVTSWLICTAVLAVALFQGIEMYRKYQKLINAIN